MCHLWGFYIFKRVHAGIQVAHMDGVNAYVEENLFGNEFYNFFVVRFNFFSQCIYKGCMAAFRVLTWKLLTCRGGPLATRCRPSTAASALCSSLASATLLLAIQIREIQPRLGNFHLHVGITEYATDLKVLLIVHLGPVLLQHQVDVQPRVDAELVSSWEGCLETIILDLIFNH